MSQILSLGLENKISQVSYSSSFPANSKVHFRIPDFMLNAVEFIGKYCGLNDDEPYNFAITETRDFLLQIDSEDNLNEFRNKFKIDWVESSYRCCCKVKTHQGLFNIENPFMYNLLITEFNIPKNKYLIIYLDFMYSCLLMNIIIILILIIE